MGVAEVEGEAGDWNGMGEVDSRCTYGFAERMVDIWEAKTGWVGLMSGDGARWYVGEDEAARGVDSPGSGVWTNGSDTGEREGDLAPLRRGGGGGGGGRRTLGVVGDKLSVLADGIWSVFRGTGDMGEGEVGDDGGEVIYSTADSRLGGGACSDSKTSQESKVSRL